MKIKFWEKPKIVLDIKKARLAITEYLILSKDHPDLFPTHGRVVCFHCNRVFNFNGQTYEEVKPFIGVKSELNGVDG